ncbi:MAG: CotH kinase family protein [Lachnospiraceae bacterium]|nr:CotH kinase family protein [Lachnospiraceae bacterium]
MRVTDTRKIITAALLLISALLLIAVFAVRREKGSFSSFLVTEDAFLHLMEDRSEDPSLLPASVTFSDAPLFFDRPAKTCYYSLIEGAADAFDPSVFYTAAGASPGSGVRLAVSGGDITEAAIAEDHTWQLLFYNDTAYALCSLKCTTLPLLSLNSDQSIGDSENEMSLVLFDNRKNVLQRSVRSDGTVRLRGRTTRYLPKPGLRIKLTERSLGDNLRSRRVSLLGMRQDDDWLLYSAYNDQERVRRVFSCNLWYDTCASHNDLGLPLGMEFRYVELFVNGEYYGLYALGYPIDNGVAHTNPEKGEVLYKKYEWYEEEDVVFAADSSIKGYHIAGSQDDPDGGDTADDIPPMRDDFVFLRDYLKGLFLNADDPAALEAMVDMDNAIDNYLFYNLIQGLDNVSYNNIKNIFLAAKEQDGIRKIFYIPWDIDVTWGNGFGLPQEGKISSYIYSIPASRNTVMCQSVVEELINADPERMLKIVTDRYFFLRSGMWSDRCLDEMLLALEKKIFASGAYRRDITRWPGSDRVDPEEGLDRFRSYVRERLACTDAYYEKLAEEGAENFYRRQLIAAEDVASRDLLIGLNDPDILQDDPELATFLNDQGVDIGSLMPDDKYILISRADSTAAAVTTYPALSSYEDSILTASGQLRILDEFGMPVENDFTVSDENAILLYLGDNEVWEINAPANRFADPPVQMALLNKDGAAEILDTERFFTPLRGIRGCADFEVFTSLLALRRCDVVVEIFDPDLLENEAFLSSLSSIGADIRQISPACDTIVFPAGHLPVSCHDAHLLSAREDQTAIGSLASYPGQDGIYGAYLNGQELYQSEEKDISCRFVLLQHDHTPLVIGCSEWTFDLTEKKSAGLLSGNVSWAY